MARTSFIQTPSNTALITTAEAKNHLRIPSSTTQDDTYIDALVLSAQDAIEKYCNIILFETTCIQYGDTWDDTLQLYHIPVENSGKAEITDIKYLAIGSTGSTYTTWTQTGNWYFDQFSCPLRIVPENSIEYPDIEERINAVKITYKVGYTNTDEVPKLLRQAALIMVGHWYENRQEAIVGRSVGTIPMTATFILDKYKIRTFGLPSIMS